MLRFKERSLQADEFGLQKNLSDAQRLVHESLCDNINTRAALDALGELIKLTNIYLTKKEASGALPNPFLLKRVAGYVMKILAVFG